MNETFMYRLRKICFEKNSFEIHYELNFSPVIFRYKKYENILSFKYISTYWYFKNVKIFFNTKTKTKCTPRATPWIQRFLPSPSSSNFIVFLLPLELVSLSESKFNTVNKAFKSMDSECKCWTASLKVSEQN